MFISFRERAGEEYEVIASSLVLWNVESTRTLGSVPKAEPDVPPELSAGNVPELKPGSVSELAFGKVQGTACGSVPKAELGVMRELAFVNAPKLEPGIPPELTFDDVPESELGSVLGIAIPRSAWINISQRARVDMR
ncbi:unnamed protein product [Toxocara canis]|uniref:TOBE_2 domain-containing protein n=1 Tax=Toxocara canis TaxID=6265 RepID=A0A183VFQ5_TOXCA|nr:unnamed protein product [Toxocara canis]